MAEVRAAEKDLMARLPEGELMRRASFGLAAAIVDYLGGVYGKRILLLVGAGDNGGDALLAGVELVRRGGVVEAVLLGENAHVGPFVAAGGRVVTVATARRPALVVDGIVGIGGRPGLRPDAAEAVAAFDGVPLVAVDLPSGVDVDSGRLEGSRVDAELTVTFGTHKVCHLVDPGAQAAGAVHLVDIGLELGAPALEALQASDVARLVPRPSPTGQKYDRGVVAVHTGSQRFPGAAVLSVAGAAAGLTGMVRYVGPAGEAVIAAHPHVVLSEGRAQAWVVGCGSGADAQEAFAHAVHHGVPVVVDADALRFVPSRFRQAELVLTPHAGELATLLGLDRGEVEANQLVSVRDAAERFGAVVVLKGRRSLIASPDGRIRVNTSGNPWLATAGSGDVLAGVIGALIASGLSGFDAASVGCWLHGAAANLASDDGPLTPLLLAAALPDVVAAL